MAPPTIRSPAVICSGSAHTTCLIASLKVSFSAVSGAIFTCIRSSTPIKTRLLVEATCQQFQFRLPVPFIAPSQAPSPIVTSNETPCSWSISPVTPKTSNHGFHYAHRLTQGFRHRARVEGSTHHVSTIALEVGFYCSCSAEHRASNTKCPPGSSPYFMQIICTAGELRKNNIGQSALQLYH